MLRLLALLAAGGLFAAVQEADAQSMSIGSGKIIYQILFKEWANPEDKLWTGKKCDIIGRRCDTRFLGYVDVLGDDSSRSGSDYTWPGPNKNEKKWPIIGKSSYKGIRLTDFAYLNLTGIENGKFREAILRVKVVDRDVLPLLGDDEINSYIGRLPGLQDLVVQRYESDAEFSKPIILEPLSTALPGVQKGKPDRTTVQQQHLHVVVRAWGEDLRRSSSSSSSRRPSSSSSVASRNRRPPVREDTVAASGGSDDSADDSTSISSRTRSRLSGSSGERSFTRTRDVDTSSDVESGGGSFLRNTKPKSSDDFFQRKLHRS